VDPRICLDAVKKEEIMESWESNPDLSAHSPSLYRPLFSLAKKAVPITGRGGQLGCETSRLPHFLDNRLTDGGEVVSLTRQPPFTPLKIHGTHFC
jgi:hypothetical protein